MKFVNLTKYVPNAHGQIFETEMTKVSWQMVEILARTGVAENGNERIMLGTLAEKLQQHEGDEMTLNEKEATLATKAFKDDAKVTPMLALILTRCVVEGTVEEKEVTEKP